MTILLIGKSGQLAHSFQDYFVQHGVEATVLGSSECDIRDRDQVLRAVRAIKPSVIINTSAYVFVDKAEEEREAAFAINRHGVRHLVEAAAEHGARLVHFGTDYVFDGKKGSPYVEADETNPLNVYGESKLAGEKEALCYHKSLVLRTSWLYGPGENNFVHKFLQFSAGKVEVPGTADEFSIPTWTSTLVDVTMRALEKEFSGLYHAASRGRTNRAGWAREIATIMNRDVIIKDVPMSSWNLPAPRAHDTTMSSSALEEALDIQLPEWQEALRAYLLG